MKQEEYGKAEDGREKRREETSRQEKGHEKDGLRWGQGEERIGEGWRRNIVK